MAENRDDSQEKNPGPHTTKIRQGPQKKGRFYLLKEIFVFTSLFAGILLFI